MFNTISLFIIIVASMFFAVFIAEAIKQKKYLAAGVLINTQIINYIFIYSILV